MNNIQPQKINVSAGRLGAAALIMAISSIFLAFGLDIFAFKEVILQFIAALIMPIIAFLFFCILMIITIMFIFGIYLIEEYGFWPLTLSIKFFKEIIGDIKVTPEEISTFFVCRIILIVLCISIIVLAILSKVSNPPQDVWVNGEIRKAKNRGATGMSNAALVLGIIGLLVSIGAIALVSQY